MSDHDEARKWAKRLGRVGAWTFDIERLSAAAARDYVRELEGLGIAALWIPESLGSKEIFAHAGLLLASTERLIIASGIANMWARDATAMANGQRALTEAYPGRFLLGIGVSHAPVVKMRGATYDKPVESMARYLEAMDKAPFTGVAPSEPPGRVLAALGPRMLRLSGERSLGAHPYFVPVEHTAIARKELGAGPAPRGRASRGPLERPGRRARDGAQAHEALPRSRELCEQPEAHRLERRGSRGRGKRHARGRDRRLGRRRRDPRACREASR